MEEQWTEVDRYFEGLFVGKDQALEHALDNSRARGLPAINVSPCQGRLLHIIAVVRGARRVLEVGTLGGYSTICLARGVGPDGRVMTIESKPEHADVAEENLRHAGVAGWVTVLRGNAREVLDGLVQEDPEPFDLIFLDADKPGNPVYLAYALKLARSGTVIIGDNVVREGRVTDAEANDEAIVRTREFCRAQADDQRLLATAIQTTGVKGWDGFTMAVVR
jgi:predicted O-methyltransferase YrrM